MKRSLFGTIALGSALLLVASEPVSAQKGGGGGGRGGSVGGGNRGGSVGGNFSGGNRGGNFGGSLGGNFGGYRGGTGHYGFHYHPNHGFHYGYHNNHPNHNYYRGGYGYGGYGGYYDYYPSIYPAYDYGYYDNGYAQPAPVATTTAQIQVMLPDGDGEVWFDGQKTRQVGTTRSFSTPALEPGKTFSYQVSAAWHQNGRLVGDERTVTVTSGQTTVVDFTKPDPTKQKK